MADQEAVAQFVSITSATESTARFYLESSGGNLEAAVDAFFSSGGAQAPTAAPQAAPAAAAPAGGGGGLMAELAAARAARAGAAGGGAGGAGPSAGGGARRAGTAHAGNVRSLSDLGGEEDSEDDDEHNDYYAGGEKSGQVIRGAPSKKRGADDDEDAVGDLFDRAREAGAEEGRAEDLRAGGAGGSRAFSGVGRTLAGGEVAPPPPPAQSQVRAVTIAFYRNGVFTVDDGEPRRRGSAAVAKDRVGVAALRRMDDPANAPFMQAIMRGQCPPELDPGDPSIQASPPARASPHINVNLVRRDEEYTPPAQPRHKAFGGTAHKLSEPAGGGDAGASSSAAAAAAPAGLSVPWEGADQSLPLTSIQLRLADGSRMVAEFNLQHTVADIRRFIRASRPDTPTAYRLSTAFPPRQLDDDGATIEAAGLANSVIIQRL
eukprot:scaffold3.g6342.t1